MKMIVSDYDDTFSVDENNIKNNVINASNFMKDNLFVIATGRSFINYEKARKLYDIKTSYTIINHGATILKDNKIIYNRAINNTIKSEFIKELELEKTTYSYGCNGYENTPEVTSDNLTKICICYESETISNRIYTKLINKYGNYINVFKSRSSPEIEIVSNEVNKSNAIKILADIEKINKEDIYTIGDSYTDIEMIKNYNGYAIKNAIPKVKENAIGNVDSVSNLIELVNKLI